MTSYFTNPQVIDEIESFQQAGPTYYPLTDGLGSVYAVTNSSGSVAATYSYEVYGTRTQTSGTLALSFGYTGREHDGDSGLIYARNRVNSPFLGIWLSPDPLHRFGPSDPNLIRYVSSDDILSRNITRAGEQINGYRYVRNEPTRLVDPQGLSSLIYDDISQVIILWSRYGEILGEWSARNVVTYSANGQWPEGTFKFSYYNPHAERGPGGPYGSHGIFIFDVPGRTGMGVHSGRANYSGECYGPMCLFTLRPTLGCIRTTDVATEVIYRTHFGGCWENACHLPDPLEEITVVRNQTRAPEAWQQ